MTTDTLERRVLKNTKVGALSFAVSMLQTVFLVPILLQYWGSERYGIWLALMAGFTLLQALDIGHQSYIGNKLNMEYHADRCQFRRTLGSSLGAAYVVGLAELGISAIIVASGALPRLLSIPRSMVVEERLSWGLLFMMAMWLLFGSAGGIISRLMISAGKLHEFQWAGIIGRVTQFASIALVALAGGSVLEACFSFALVRSAGSLIELWYIRRLLPDLYPWWRNARWQVGFHGLRQSLTLTVIEMFKQLSNGGVVILVSTLLAATVIPSFTTLRTVANTVNSVTTILMFAVLPDIVRFHVTSKMGKVADTLDGHWFLAGLVVNGGILLLLPFIEPLYHVWTRGRLAFDPVLFLLLLVATSLVNVGVGMNSYLAGINDLRSQIVVAVSRSTSLFLVIYGLSGYFGIVSVGIAGVVSETLASVILPLVFVRQKLTSVDGDVKLRHWKLALIPPVLLLVVGTFVVVQEASLAWVGAGLLPVLGVTYYLHWNGLSGDVRGRISSLLLSHFRWGRA